MRICFYRILLVLLSHQIKTSPQYISIEEGAVLSMVPLNCSVRVFWNTVSVRHYNDVIMSAMSFLITSLTIVYSSAYSGADQRKHQSSAPLAFMRGIHRWPVNSPHKGPATPKMFPFDDVIMGRVLICCSIWYPSETQPKLKSREISFVPNIHFISTKQNVMTIQRFARFHCWEMMN